MGLSKKFWEGAGIGTVASLALGGNLGRSLLIGTAAGAANDYFDKRRERRMRGGRSRPRRIHSSKLRRKRRSPKKRSFNSRK
jgi:hypothetical protein